MKKFKFISLLIALCITLTLPFSNIRNKVFATSELTNLAAGKLPTSSSPFTNPSRISDGNKNTNYYLDSTPNSGLQWLQIDLGQSYNINNVKLWHYFGDTRKYHDVIVQLSNDPNFLVGVSTVFNNDTDNSAQLGAGTDTEYTETSSGKNIIFNAINSRYIRLYSNGSTANKYNHYVELEVFEDTTLTIDPTSPANLAEGILPDSSTNFINLPRITDGDKNINYYSDSSPNIGLQWIQLDLGKSYNINNIILWHYFGDTRKYHDIIVQLSNDPNFLVGVSTVFNNDTDNSANLGFGTDAEYIETSAGKNILFNAVNTRYVRLYSNGSTANMYNHYVEVEIYDGITTETPPPNDPDPIPPPPVIPPSVIPLNHAETYLNLPTYDGSNMSTHPSVQYFENGWNGHKYWMSMTPNTGGSNDVENPCIYTSEDGLNWSVPTGVTNPLVPSPTVGHNCDTDLIYNSQTDELWIYYLESNDISCSFVNLIKSGDGIHWSSPQTIIYDYRAKYSIISPTVSYSPTANKYYMWSVNTGNSGWLSQNNFVELRESTDGITWSNPISVPTFAQANYQVWHIFVKYIPSKNEYWSVFAAYPNESNSTNTVLYYAKSVDGINWSTYNNVALGKGPSGSWDNMEIYRSCFVYDPSTDKIKIWYSGIQASGYIWKIGYTETNYSSFITNLTK